jgi:spoIIIJ-associated protein
MSAEERVRTVVEAVVDSLDPGAEVTITDDGETLKVDIQGPDLGQIIGRHGATLEAIQHISYRAASVKDEDRRRIDIDAGGWRERRAEELKEIADQAADDAVDSRESVALPAMSASERRVVHEYLRDREDVDTVSEGREPNRRLVVEPLDD